MPELVGTFDEILCRVTSWLNGNTLAQTVYTCFYLLDPTKVEDLHLRAQDDPACPESDSIQ